MSERQHISGRERCPHLPAVHELWLARDMAAHQDGYGVQFYLAALSFAQSLWLEGKPAQALLQMNKAFLADLQGDEPELQEWPLPYAAKAWLLARAGESEFLGNPVRHYQHLATRMSGARAELRTWRAWACFHLAERVLGREGFPRDEAQIEKEGLVVPEEGEVLERLEELGWAGEAGLVEKIWSAEAATGSRE